MEKKELKIKTDSGMEVALISIVDNALHGPCVWMNGFGDTVADGTFKDGLPYSGTVLNWSLIFPELSENPYDPAIYGKDWVSLYEMMYASEIPDYARMTETYENGVLVQAKDQ